MNHDEIGLSGWMNGGVMSTVRQEWNMECPECHDDSHIEISALIWVELHVDGTSEEGSDHEWDNDSAAKCTACDYGGNVGEFQIKKEET